MKTSQKDYNELLYIIEDPNYNTMIPLEVGEDGYPIISENGIYFYSTDYTRFTGTVDSIRQQWDVENLPSFYCLNENGSMIEILDYSEDGYPILVKDQIYFYKYNYVSFQGSPEELREKWPNVLNLPVFYKKQLKQYYRIPADEPVYEIDLNTRTVQAPEYLSVFEDHNAEVIWFKINRFYDNIDLFGATCWIQYKNALKEEYISVTLPKVIAESSHDVLYIPWPINNAVTKAAGDVTFSFQFFKIGESQKVLFSLHTKPATSKILAGLHVTPDKFLYEKNDIDINPQYSDFIEKFKELSEAYATLSANYNVYWLEV